MNQQTSGLVPCSE